MDPGSARLCVSRRSPSGTTTRHDRRATDRGACDKPERRARLAHLLTEMEAIVKTREGLRSGVAATTPTLSSYLNREPVIIPFYFPLDAQGRKGPTLPEEANLAYEPIPVDINKGEQHTAAFRAINPNGKVP